MQAMQAMDKALAASGLTPAKVDPTKTLADTPVIRGFVSRFPTAGAQSVQDFYDEYQRRKTSKGTVSYLAKTGEPELAQGEADVRSLETAESAYRAIGNQQKLIRDIYRDKTMKGDEKRALIDGLYLDMIEVAKLGNEVFAATSSKDRRPAKALDFDDLLSPR
jgi:hypothetical protein